MLQEAGELIGSEEVKLIELANAIDTHAIRRDADAPVELPPIPYIVSVARLDEGQKDHTTLLRAFAQLRSCPSGNVRRSCWCSLVTDASEACLRPRPMR